MAERSRARLRSLIGCQFLENADRTAAPAPRLRRPRSTTVRPGRASARTSAAVRVRGNGDVRAHAARRGVAPQFLADRPRRPSSRSRPRTSIDDEIVAVPLVARRKSCGDLHERVRVAPPSIVMRRRAIQHRRTAAVRARGWESRRRAIRRQCVATVAERLRRVLPTRARANDARVDIEPFEQSTRNTPTLASTPSAARIPRPCSPACTVSPAELRAIGSLPTSTHVVWLPSTIRCSRSQVVNGSRRSASAGASPDVEHDQTEVAGLQHERERPDRLLHRALVQVAAQPGIGHDVPADPEQPIEIDRRPPPPTRRRTCRAHRRARRARRARSPPPSCCSSRLVRPDDRGPTSSDSWPRGNPPPSRASNAAMPVARRRIRRADRAAAAPWSACDRAGGRGAAIRGRRGASGIVFSLYFRLDGEL